MPQEKTNTAHDYSLRTSYKHLLRAKYYSSSRSILENNPRLVEKYFIYLLYIPRRLITDSISRNFSQSRAREATMKKSSTTIYLS